MPPRSRTNECRKVCDRSRSRRRASPRGVQCRKIGSPGISGGSRSDRDMLLAVGDIVVLSTVGSESSSNVVFLSKLVC